MKYTVTVHIGGKQFRTKVEAENPAGAIYMIRGRIRITAEMDDWDIKDFFGGIFR